MEYIRETVVDGETVCEVFEGTCEEIIELMNRMPRELKYTELEGGCVNYNQEDAIDFIKKDDRASALTEFAIRNVLDAEEDYMRSIGIVIGDETKVNIKKPISKDICSLLSSFGKQISEDMQDAVQGSNYKQEDKVEVSIKNPTSKDISNLTSSVCKQISEDLRRAMSDFSYEQYN